MKPLVHEQREDDCGQLLKSAGLVIVGLMALLAIGVSTVSAQPYTVTDLGAVSGMKVSTPSAINNQGYVTGTSFTGSQTCAFIYKGDAVVDAGGIGSRGHGINESGVVVGDSIFRGPIASVSRAAILKDGVAIDLGVLKGDLYGRANGINTFEQVVGSSGPMRDSPISRAFVWTAATGMVDIGSLGGQYAQAQAINDAGFITGTAQTADSRLIGSTHAFLYQLPSAGDGFIRPMEDLGTLGGPSSYGMAISSNNLVAGYSMISATDERVHAFLYVDGKMFDLGAFDGGLKSENGSAALGINESGEVVGYSYIRADDSQALTQVAFVYNSRYNMQRGGMVDLNRLIGDASKEHWLLSANAINDKGQIVASSFEFADNTIHSILLTPNVPGLGSEGSR